MAIPISDYISISSKMLSRAGGTYDLSALIVTSDSLKSEIAEEYQELADKYDEGTAISIDRDGLNALFGSDSEIHAFGTKYFGYSANVNTLHVVKAINTNIDAIVRGVIEGGLTNFGAFATLTTITDEMATKLSALCSGYGYRYVFACATTTSDAESRSAALMGASGTHVVLGDDTAVWMPLAFVASLDYTRQGASDTIDFKNFGDTATVTTHADKVKYDNLRINYVGLTQTRSQVRKFYQTGVNMDGIDLGAYMDACWIQSQIEDSWLGLVEGGKIPANINGAATVKAMVTGVAETALANGAILSDKPLTPALIEEINSFAGNANAAQIVQTVGYYVDANVVFTDGKYVCQYTLVYAKADHIMKVTGAHYIA